MTRPNSISTNYGYDNLSRLLSVLHQSGSTTLDGATYTVDNAGNHASKTQQPSGPASNFTYDALYELTQVTQGANTTESYTYDPVGNRLSSLGVSPYNVNTSNELTSTPNASYGYDYNGNAVTKNDSTGITTYAWDFENRLTTVTLPGSGGTISFKYDPFGRRTYKSSSSGTSIYAFDLDNLIEETNASGAVVVRYAQGENIDEPLAMLRSGTTSFYHADGLGSITSLSSGSGSIAQTYTFDSFGKTTNSSGSLMNPFQYTSRELDGETNLYYFRARYFDPNVGRFTSEDLIRFEDDINMYSYVANNAPNLRDPLGLYKIDASNCNCSQIGALKRVEDPALAATGAITNTRLADCIRKKMKKGMVHCESGKCRNPDPQKGWAGHGIKKFGTGISICTDSFGAGDTFLICTIVHEFAHKCSIRSENYIRNIEKQVPGCSQFYQQ